MYFKNGRVKVAVSLAKGKKDYDKRETIKRREADRETRAAVKSRGGRMPQPMSMTRSAARSPGAVPAAARRDPRGDHPRLRQPALHHGTGDRRARARAGARCSASTHAIAVSSGTDALLLALMALGIGPGDEVVTHDVLVLRDRRRDRARWARRRCSSTSIRRPSTSIRRRLAAAITPRTKAIMPVHLFGLSADIDPIMDVADARRRAGDRGRGAGDRRDLRSRQRSAAIGAFGCFSFFPSKNLGAFGDAGLLTTNDAGAGRARAAAAHARHGAEVLPPPGRRQLPDGRAAGRGAARQGAAPGGLDRGPPRQRRALPQACSATPGVDGAVTLPVEPPDRRHIFNQFVIRVADRDGAQASPRRAGHRQRDLLPGAVPPAAVLRGPRLPRRRVSARRARRRENAGDSDLRRADAAQQETVVEPIARVRAAARRRRARRSRSAPDRRSPTPRRS